MNEARCEICTVSGGYYSHVSKVKALETREAAFEIKKRFEDWNDGDTHVTGIVTSKSVYIPFHAISSIRVISIHPIE